MVQCVDFRIPFEGWRIDLFIVGLLIFCYIVR